MGSGWIAWLVWGGIAAAVLLLVSRVLVPWVLELRGVHMSRTMFGVALVFDGEDEDGSKVRYLNVDGVFQSVCYEDPELRDSLACEYHRHFARVIGKRFGCGPSSGPDAQQTGNQQLRALVIGGGGFAFPKHLAASYPDMQVDAVEIDPAIIELARKWFHLDEARAAHPNLNVVQADGWKQLREGGTWDIIVNDAFSGKEPLGSLGTADGARIVREHLSPEGLYLANVRSSISGKKARVLEDLKRVFGAEFANVRVYAERPEDPDALAYNAFVASDSPIPD